MTMDVRKGKGYDTFMYDTAPAEHNAWYAWHITNRNNDDDGTMMG